MKDMNGKQVNIGDTVLIPIESEGVFDFNIKDEICEKFTVVPALLSGNGELLLYVQDNIILLEK